MIAYFSTNRGVSGVSLDQALLQGQAGDKGLFLPRPIPKISKDLLTQAGGLSYAELAAAVIEPYAVGVFSPDVLREICEDAYDFEVPLEKVDARRYVMRLDRGPTASFKDFAARFMGRALGRLVRERGEDLVILTATSGDTGSAIAHAFSGIERIRVVILFPREEISRLQRKQMTMIGGNVATLAVEGKFDDCQAMVKRAFADSDLSALHLSSANSINIGRLIPQSVYYVFAASRLVDVAAGEEVVFAVPCGNFGNLVGGILAMKAGLPVARMVVATNANDEVPRFLSTGRYEKVVPSRVCLSNAMNVGHPSNLARLVQIYGGQMDEQGRLVNAPDLETMRQELFAVSIGEEATIQTIRDAYRDHGVLLEPHGAVGWAGMKLYQVQFPGRTMVSLETAHPAKFPEAIQEAIGVTPPLPSSMEGLEERPEHFLEMAADYEDFKSRLIREYSS